MSGSIPVNSESGFLPIHKTFSQFHNLGNKMETMILPFHAQFRDILQIYFRSPLADLVLAVIKL